MWEVEGGQIPEEMQTLPAECRLRHSILLSLLLPFGGIVDRAAQSWTGVHTGAWPGQTAMNEISSPLGTPSLVFAFRELKALRNY